MSFFKILINNFNNNHKLTMYYKDTSYIYIYLCIYMYKTN